MKNQHAADIFREYLKKRKYRITPERFEVLDAALEYSGHFGADDLYISIKNAKSSVSRATVYNTLELLAKCELMSKRNFGDNITRYESSYKRKNHDHVICVECGKISEFISQKVSKIQEEICKELDVEGASYSFNIYAKCKNHSQCENNIEKN